MTTRHPSENFNARQKKKKKKSTKCVQITECPKARNEYHTNLSKRSNSRVHNKQNNSKVFALSSKNNSTHFSSCKLLKLQAGKPEF